LCDVRICKNLSECISYIDNSNIYLTDTSAEKYYSDCDFIVAQQVNRDYEEPTDGDIELWKIGEKDLFNQYTRIGIKINNRQIDLDLVLALLDVKEER